MGSRSSLHIEEDIRNASTLPGWGYSDPQLFERSREKIFARSWQWVADTDRLRAPELRLRAQLGPQIEAGADGQQERIRAHDFEDRERRR